MQIFYLSKRIFPFFIIALVSTIISSCKEKSEMDPGEMYHCYRPMNNIGGTKVFGHYMMSSSCSQTRMARDWKDLACDCLVPTTYDQNTGNITVQKGYHPADPQTSDFISFQSLNNPLLTSVQYLKTLNNLNSPSSTQYNQRSWTSAGDAFSYDPVYQGANIDDMTNCEYVTCQAAGAYQCKPVIQEFNPSPLPNPDYTQNINLEPILKANAMWLDGNSGDYFFSATQDKGSSINDPKVKYVYVKVSSLQMPSFSKSRVTMRNDALKNNTDAVLAEGADQFVTFDRLSGSQDSRVRYCSPGVRLVQFKLPAAGTYTLYYVNLDQPDNTGTLALGGQIVDQNSFVVSSTDFFVDPADNSHFTTSSSKRTLQLNVMSVPGMTTYIDGMKLPVLPTFEEALENAFTLDLKSTLAAPVTGGQVDFDFTFNSFRCQGQSYTTSYSEPLFDDNGRLKIQKSLYENYLANHPGKHYEALLQAVNNTYALLVTTFGNSCSGLTTTTPVNQILIFSAKGAVFYDDAYGNEQTDPDNIISTYMPLGYTGPTGVNIQGAALAVCGVFEDNLSAAWKTLTGQVPTTVQLQSIAVSSMAHEIGHAWAQDFMYDKTAANPTNGHNNLCGGYNKYNCVFRYGDDYNRWNKYIQNGIIWCESHQQIIMNQLVRKPYQPQQ